MTSPFSPRWDMVEMLASTIPHPRKVEIPELLQPHGLPQLAHRNNNPGNLKFRGQAGAELGDRNFARFSTPEEGYDALIAHLKRYQESGVPLGAFVASYAPPSENDTDLYVSQLSQVLGVDPGTPIDQIPTEELAKAVMYKESKASAVPAVQNPITQY